MSDTHWKAYELTVNREWHNDVTIRIERPAEIVEYFRKDAILSTQEALWVALVDGRNNLIGITQVFKGTATGTSVTIADLLRPALITGAVGFIMVHNHPSGDSEPSDQDLHLTEDTLKAAHLMDLTMLDHVVVAKNNFSSIRSQKPGMWELNAPERMSF